MSNSGWISVDDRLPETGCEVLAYIKHLNPRFGPHTVVLYASASPDHFWEYDEGELSYNWNVTHWMPLPEPPSITES